MIDLFRKCYDLVGQDRPWKWLALVVLALIVTALEALGAGLIFALLALITDPHTPLRLPVIGDVSRFLPDAPNDHVLLAVAAAVAVFIMIRSFVVFGQAYLQHRVAHRAGAKLATRLLRGYLSMPYAFHLQRNSAELIRNALQSVQSVINHAVMPMVRLLAEALIIAGLIAVLVSVSPLATAVAAAVLGPMVWVLLRVVHPRVKRLGRRAQRASRDGLQTAQQSLHGIRDVKLLGREQYFTQDFARSRRDYAHSQYTRAALAELPPVLIESGLVVFIVLFFAVALLIGDGAEGTLSVLGLFAYVGLRLQPSLRRIAAATNNLKFGSAAVDDVHGDLRQFPESAPAPPQGQAAGELPFREALTLDDVTFRYEGSRRPALDGVRLTIKRGQALGICGPTGGGKSTLVDLIVGLLEPTAGQVLVDGQDIRHNLASWQAQLGVVSQSVFLVDGSLRENIALGVPGAGIDDGRVAEAVRLAQLEAFVATLPEGLETRVGERGVRLSGGQRQRVAIARALYRRPSVIVFDEGTSALDNQTEAELVEALEHLRGERTLIMVAHRLTTVRRCDRILLVEDGRLADSGTFEELAARHQLFAAFAPQ